MVDVCPIRSGTYLYVMHSLLLIYFTLFIRRSGPIKMLSLLTKQTIWPATSQIPTRTNELIFLIYVFRQYMQYMYICIVYVTYSD